MNEFGRTVRKIRLAQNRGLRETASDIGISPAYLSRIERGKEPPPAPTIIKELADVLMVEPEQLFRLAAVTDPDILALLQTRPKVNDLVRLIMERDLSDAQIDSVSRAITEIPQR
ncbi:MAG: helix-turn-helix domain-containing protein [Anaerolineae bacterium]|nr:helix-turn-helix domain-containing protein [Anaerolineae bacterium]MCO5189317.1 helix-turn-helix domain-containing protein [Anaerolineae bacterium]MCO5192889.1 helix-turn-helix domain-containing protein [Anaerolineae bacterium]MCO5198294.1 helix-turn-helix domain-containing protein [Anaerolineae bacterium]MCO5205256.1 helix-turn-helix domain-containing protein [Anaerolineae bacterium]